MKEKGLSKLEGIYYNDLPIPLSKFDEFKDKMMTIQGKLEIILI